VGGPADEAADAEDGQAAVGPGEQEGGEVGGVLHGVVGELLAAGPPGGEEVAEDAQADGDAADGDDLHCGVLQRRTATPSVARVRMSAHVPVTGGTVRQSTTARPQRPSPAARTKNTASSTALIRRGAGASAGPGAARGRVRASRSRRGGRHAASTRTGR